MAKYYNNIRKVGRVGGSVFQIRGGETIEKAYNPNVRNPSSEGQVAQRAKFKLATQLAAVLAPALYYRRVGNITPRNQFVKDLQPILSVADDVASVATLSIQLGRGALFLPTPVVSTNSATITGSQLENIDRVVFAVVSMSAGQPASLRQVSIVEPTGTGTSRTATVEGTGVAAFGTSDFVFAYGIRFNEAGASASYGDEFARLVTSSWESALRFVRTLSESDVTFTRTSVAAGTI